MEFENAVCVELARSVLGEDVGCNLFSKRRNVLFSEVDNLILAELL